jgi:plastocyanin
MHKVRTLSLLLALAAMPALAQDIAVYKLVARNGTFEPAVLEVPAGKRFRIEVSNEGPKAIEFESRDLKQEKVIAPGAKTTVTINPLKAGEYRFVDEFNEATAKGRVVAK